MSRREVGLGARGAEAAVVAGALGAILATAHTAYNLRVLRTPSTQPAAVAERVSVLVPARDEAANIGACVAALLASEGVRDLEVLVLDDGSTDGTGEIVGSLADDVRLRPDARTPTACRASRRAAVRRPRR